MATISAVNFARLGLPLAAAAFIGCADAIFTEGGVERDPARRYIEDAGHRRDILERDLTEPGNAYAEQRLTLYGRPGFGWDALPERDPPSRPLLVTEVGALLDGEPLEVAEDAATALAPDELPGDEAGWIELGRRVFFGFPLRADAVYEALALVPDGFARAGFLVDDDGAYVGLRAFLDDDGRARIGNTCAQCHASRDHEGAITGSLSNRAMDVGVAQLLASGFEPGELPPEIESTSVADLDRLGAGRADVLPDGEFNPYAFPDFGGIADIPYLHHNANWVHRGTETLAVRCETLFITSAGQSARIPRELTWALASYLRSLPPPAPLEPGPTPATQRGEEVFAAAGCANCHVPPLYTSDREVGVEEIGTDPAAGLSPMRWTGRYRIPSLRGVGRAAPYLHHGAFPTLEEMFDPERSEPGHRFGLELGADDRAALLAFLRSI